MEGTLKDAGSFDLMGCGKGDWKRGARRGLAAADTRLTPTNTQSAHTLLRRLLKILELVGREPQTDDEALTWP